MPHDVCEEPIAKFQAFRQSFWRADEEIQRKLTIEFHANSRRLRNLVARRHDDEQIDIAVPIGSAFSIRAKQDHPLRLKALDDLADRAFQFGFRDELFGLCVGCFHGRRER